MTDVEVEGPGIRLGQLLKLAGLVDTGGAARPLLGAGQVRVNGTLETRRGRQLRHGDVVAVSDRGTVRVVVREADPDQPAAGA